MNQWYAVYVVVSCLVILYLFWWGRAESKRADVWHDSSDEAWTKIERVNQRILEIHHELDGTRVNLDHMTTDRNRWQEIAKWVPDPMKLASLCPKPEDIDDPLKLVLKYRIEVEGYVARHARKRGENPDVDVVLELRPILNESGIVDGHAIYAPWNNRVLAVSHPDFKYTEGTLNNELPSTLTLDRFDQWYRERMG